MAGIVINGERGSIGTIGQRYVAVARSEGVKVLSAVLTGAVAVSDRGVRVHGRQRLGRVGQLDAVPIVRREGHGVLLSVDGGALGVTETRE